MSPRVTLHRFVVVLSTICVAALSACSDSDSGSDNASPNTTVDPSALIIDVRTAEEFASGHLEGAINIDAQSDDFEAQVAELDNTKSYVVYCRSGNRSAAAMAVMNHMGFADVTNAGSLESAAASAGRPIVTE